MHVLVTGGAGFIGSHVARRFLEKGDRVTVLDNLSTGRIENLPKGARLLRLDLSDEGFVASLPRDRVDCVVHLAAQSSGEISFERPAYDLKTNTLGTLLLLRWALDQGVERFLYSSSMSVYGNGADRPLTEADRPAPKSFYGVGKVASEEYITIFHDLGLPTTILRFFNVYGPGQNMANLKQGMVSIYMAYIGQGEPILVRGSLERFRDFVYIDDILSAIEHSLGDDRADGGIFNVCTGRKTTIRELLGIIVRTFGKPPSYPVLEGSPTPRDQFGVYGSYELIHSTLGWKPEVTLEDGVAMMAAWVKEFYTRAKAR